MASFAVAGRLSLRVAGRQVRPARAFATTARAAAAQNFTMPALSPTMTEGGISAWRVKEGDAFVAGDVLLEIETDKASMDVEAQEDGRVFKILQADGSKGVPVGARIAVLAEADDDLSTLSIPADEPAAASVAAPASPSTPAPATPAPTTTTAPAPPTASAKIPVRWPLYPSVAHLIKQNGLDPKTVVPDMTPTGPGGRLLKGDVLAYLGRIAAAVPLDLEARLDKLSHLDLSNIKIRAPAPASDADAKADAKATTVRTPSAPTPTPSTSTSVSLGVSLAAVVDAQAKIQASLGVFLPVSTFVARATDVANDELPRAGPAPAPSASELFDAVVSATPSARTASTASTTSRGAYRPTVSALPAAPKPKKTVDVLDILSGKVRATTPARLGSAAASGAGAAPVSTGINFFSLSVPQAEAKRAQVFLERLKVVLENEPGRLVL